MGHVQHHAIIVTTFDRKLADTALEHAKLLGCSVTPVIESNINSEWTFLVGPDGSKSGWRDDENGDERREKFKAWMEEMRNKDGSHPLSWVEVAYSSDDQRAEVVADVWEAGRPVRKA